MKRVGIVAGLVALVALLVSPVGAQDTTTLLSNFLVGLRNGTIGSTTLNLTYQAADGTSGAPSIAFASEPTLGFYRLSATNMKLMGSLVTSATAIIGGNLSVDTNGALTWNSGTKSAVRSSSDGIVSVENVAGTIGSKFKADALPTIASACGTSPSIAAGSTALAGLVNIGTGGTATSCVVNFNGTNFPSAPFCVVSNVASNTVTRVATSTTQLTLNTTTAWVSGEFVTYQCISAK